MNVLREKIDSASLEQHLEIFKLFQSENISFSETANGVFVNLCSASPQLLVKIKNYLETPEPVKEEMPVKEEKKIQDAPQLASSNNIISEKHVSISKEAKEAKDAKNNLDIFEEEMINEKMLKRKILWLPIQDKIEKKVINCRKLLLKHCRIYVEKDYGIDKNDVSNEDEDILSQIPEEPEVEDEQVLNDIIPEIEVSSDIDEDEDNEDNLDDETEGKKLQETENEDTNIDETNADETTCGAEDDDEFLELDTESAFESDVKLDFGNFTMKDKISFYKKLLNNIEFGNVDNLGITNVNI